MKRRVMSIAWAIRNQFTTFAEALKHAWQTIKLQWALCLGVAVFKYKKVDGSIREARGTVETVPATKGTKRPVNFGVLTYFDMDAQYWRSAKIENLIFA
jgi:hypothetical protein